MEIVTIDGETARDFDDAVWVDRLPNGNYALHVHIADVSHYVRPGTPIDAEARLRGTSVYFPDRAVPMLPFELSTNICSLMPQEDRLVLSALLEIDHQGEVVAQEFTPGVIRSVERMTYTNVHLLLEGDAALRERYAPLVARFELMQELALILNRKRVRRGSIDFDLPEPLIEFDELGAMTGVTRAPRNIAHRLIEEFMLAANEAVAAHLEDTLEAVHLPHPREARSQARDGVRRSGRALRLFAGSGRDSGEEVRYDGPPSRRAQGSAKRSCCRMRGVEHRLAQLSEAGGQDRRQAGGAHSELPDAALAQAGALQRRKRGPLRAGGGYLHALHVAHPALSRPDRASPAARHAIGRIESRSCGAHRRGVLAIRAARRRRRARAGGVEESQVHDRSAWARISTRWSISTAKYGLFVELEDLFIEGLVPIDTLPGDQYTYHENVRKIVGKRTRREFSIGDQVRVILDRVDANERKLQFSLVEPERPRSSARQLNISGAANPGCSRLSAGTCGVRRLARGPKSRLKGGCRQDCLPHSQA